MTDTLGIDPRAIDGLSVAPDTDADQDSSDQLDKALDDSMDASDPPAATQPGTTTEPAPSSGYDAEAEKQLRDADD